MRRMLPILLLASCTQPVHLTVSPDIHCPEQKDCPTPVVIDSWACKEARQVLRYRNAQLETRMDECLKSNVYSNCSHWVYGHDDDADDEDEVPPPRPKTW